MRGARLATCLLFWFLWGFAWPSQADPVDPQPIIAAIEVLQSDTEATVPERHRTKLVGALDKAINKIAQGMAQFSAGKPIKAANKFKEAFTEVNGYARTLAWEK